MRSCSCVVDLRAWAVLGSQVRQDTPTCGCGDSTGALASYLVYLETVAYLWVSNPIDPSHSGDQPIRVLVTGFAVQMENGYDVPLIRDDSKDHTIVYIPTAMSQHTATPTLRFIYRG